MSLIACQGLQSCLVEPQLVETCLLKHILAPPKSNFSPSFPSASQHQQECQENSHEEENKHHTKLKSNNNGELGGWSFIQALTNNSQNCKQVNENEKVYVHPLAKPSTSTLSIKSLEMCTESLGSETGSDISENSDEFSFVSSKSENSPPIHGSKSREFSKKMTRSVSFPPPLTSITGSDGVQVRPHREGGRLVIKAVTVSSCNTYFQAERTDGRLRLCLVNDSSLKCTNKEVYDHDEEEESDVEEDGDGDKWIEGRGGNSGNVGCEIEIGELPRPTRCKEGGGGSRNIGMSRWGPILGGHFLKLSVLEI